MKVQFSGDASAAMEDAMKGESYNRKVWNCIQAAVMMSFYGTIGGIYTGWFSNSKKIDSAYCDPSLDNYQDVQSYCEQVDGKVYDTFWVFLDQWSDTIKANQLILEIEQDWDLSKIEKGSRFSVIYGFCGITLILLALTSACLSIGAYNMRARMAGLLCSCCLGVLNFVGLICTAVFRFNKMGQLASLSLVPSEFKATDTNQEEIPIDYNGDSTISSDASLIVGIWISQLLACIFGSCMNIYFNRPPSKD